MPRKLIQISATPETDDYSGAVFGLCDDGTLWVLVNCSEGWKQLEDVPQPEAQEENSEHATHLS